MKIPEHFAVIKAEVEKINDEHKLEADEMVAVFDIRIAAENAERVFKRRKDINA